MQIYLALHILGKAGVAN